MGMQRKFITWCIAKALGDLPLTSVGLFPLSFSDLLGLLIFSLSLPKIIFVICFPLLQYQEKMEPCVFAVDTFLPGPQK